MGKGMGLYAGIFLISTAALMLEIALTRVLSVAFWHHFAFLVISIALFGIAASGTYLNLFPVGRELEDVLSISSLLFSISVVAGYGIINQFPFDPFRFFLDRTQILLILLYYLLLSVPFFFFGLCIALSLTRRPADAGKLYFANLVGSGIGSMVVLGLFSPFGGSGVLVFCAFIGITSCFFFSGKRRFLNAIVALIFLALLLLPNSALELNISPYKSLNQALRYPDSRLISTKWNSVSRVDVLESGYVRYAPGLSLKYQDQLPPQLGMVVDGDSLSAITEYDGSPLEFTRYLTSTAPYILKQGGKALIVESGGGLEVIQALSNDASKVMVLESNPLVIETVFKMQGFSAVYSDPRVKVVESEIRSFLDFHDARFDIIEIGLSSGAPASSTGVYALTENYVFTVEAFKAYLGHLEDDGIISLTRWLQPPPRESLRTVSIAITALNELGIPSPEANIAALRSLGTITILIKKEPLTPDEIEKTRDFARSRGFDIVYLPGIQESDVNLFNRFPVDHYYLSINELLTTSSGEDFYESYLFDVRPTWDENPFFFQFLRPDRLKETYKDAGQKWQIFVEGSYIVYILLFQATFLCLFFILLPLAVLKDRMGELPINLGSLSYFFLIGLGFMFVEIPLIQKFILFLGKPVFAISTVLFGILIFSGLGSLYTSRAVLTLRRWKQIVILLVIAILLYRLMLPLFFSNFPFPDIRARYVASVIALAPIGFLMGMPLPLGIKFLEKKRRQIIPWAWAANGSASVLASILAVILAMHTGFSNVIFLASIVYFFSLLSITFFAPPQLRERNVRS
jgi:hypothetical protein